MRRMIIAVFLYPLLGHTGGIEIEELPSMLEPVSNNAVALLDWADGIHLYSFQGLAEGKTFADIHTRSWELRPGAEQWNSVQDVPADEGRLAGVAVTVGSSIYVFGGYTVAEDGSEVSTPEVFRLERAGVQFAHVSNMPVPVDDMTAFVYRKRYIYLVSGWHDLGNVNLVQVLDTHTLQWSQATPFPGAPVFGHAGGMSGSRMLVCDGVKISYPANESPRQFVMSDECWLGEIDTGDHRRIRWQSVAPHPGPARYRMGSVSDGDGRIVFAGGTGNPYNYDGIGYDGVPSEPIGEVIRFNLESLEWESGWTLTEPGMDHRGMLFHDGWFYLAGGMLAGQRVTGRVIRFRLREPGGS